MWREGSFFNWSRVVMEARQIEQSLGELSARRKIQLCLGAMGVYVSDQDPRIKIENERWMLDVGLLQRTIRSSHMGLVQGEARSSTAPAGDKAAGAVRAKVRGVASARIHRRNAG
jgi:hypothetical protein